MNLEIKNYTTERSVYLCDEIDPVSVNNLERDIQKIIDDDYKVLAHNLKEIHKLGSEYEELYKANNEFPRINLYINSNGGSIYDGLGLYDFIKSINDKGIHKIVIICQGMVASMATVIVLAADERYATEHTSIMIHSLSSLTCGKLQDLDDDLKECRRLDNILKGIYLNRSKLTANKLSEINKAKKDWWIDSVDAVKYGIVNDII